MRSIWEAVIKQQLHIRRAVIGGHSYGACAALMAGTPLLEEVSALLLLDGGYRAPTDRTPEELRSDVCQYIETTRFPDLKSFLDEEKIHLCRWTNWIATSCKATVNENAHGEIVLRADRRSAETDMFSQTDSTRMISPAQVSLRYSCCQLCLWK